MSELGFDVFFEIGESVVLVALAGGERGLHFCEIHFGFDGCA